MITINDKNIEEWIFNYHEELLTTEEKERFLHFLIEHPQYNEEFIYWANAHIIPEPSPLANELELSLLKNTVPPHSPLTTTTTNKTIGIAIGAIIAIALFYFFLSNDNTHLPRPDKKQSIRITDKSTVKAKPLVKQENHTPRVNANPYPPRKSDPRIDPKINTAEVMYHTTVEAPGSNTSVAISEPILNKKVADTMARKSYPVKTPDLIEDDNHNKETEPTKETKEINNKKRNKKISLKPSKKFKTDNPNF